MEPVRWGPGAEARFLEWITTDLRRARDARTGLEEQWRRWLLQYRVDPKPEWRRFPWEGASGWTLPIMATDCDQLYAKFLQTIHAAPNLWSCAPLNERWVETAKPAQDFLQLLQDSVLQMYPVNTRVLLEMCKLGTGIYKHGWTYQQRLIRSYNPAGQIVAAKRTLSRPFVDHVRLADFLLPPQSSAIQPDEQGGAPWVAERLRLRPDQLKVLATSGGTITPAIADQKVQQVLAWITRDQTEHAKTVQALDLNVRRFGNETKDPDLPAQQSSPGMSQVQVEEVECWEVHARFETTTGEYNDLIALVHPDSQTILRATLNPYLHGARPYEVVRYWPGDGFYGIGVGEQLEMFQRVESDLFNYTVDNTLLANALMIGYRKGSAEILPGEPFYPGKGIGTDGSPKDDLFPIKMGEINASLPNLMAMVQNRRQFRSGVGDIQMGQIQNLPGRTPATTMLSLLQEGNRRPDLTLKAMRYDGLSRVGLRVLQYCQQYLGHPEAGTNLLRVMVESLGVPEGPSLAKQLTTPMENAELGLGVAITATSQTGNKELDRQKMVELIQLAMPVAQAVVQYTGLAVQHQGNALGQVAAAAAQGITELYKRALEQHDIRDVERFVPDTLGEMAPPESGTPSLGPPAGAGPGPEGLAGGPPGGPPGNGPPVLGGQ